MRSAGCVINDFADRKIDGSVKRTAQRPLAAGLVSSGEALSLFVLLIVVAFGLVLMLGMVNDFTIVWCLSTGVLLSIYEALHATTASCAWCCIQLGYSNGLYGIDWLSAIEAWLLFTANLVWTVAYDTMYAMVDRDDDLKIGVKSTAILFARFDRHIIFLLNALFIAILAYIGMSNQLDMPYWLGLAAAVGFLLYQQTLIHKREREPCFKAFFE